jgi:hypothetical protein
MSRDDLLKVYWLRRLIRPHDVAMSGTWRLVEVLVVATPALASQRRAEWHVATWEFQNAQQGRPMNPFSTYGHCEGN